MKTYLGFSTMEYSLVFGVAIVLGAGINLFLTRLSDRLNKTRLLYLATAIFATGLFGMYLSRTGSKTATLLLFGIAGFVMITGYIFVSALCGAIVRDRTPEHDAGKLQGIRMIFAVLIPMIVGPMIGNGINKAMNVPLPDAGADAMTTEYIPAPEIFLAGALTACVMIFFVWLVSKVDKAEEK